MEAMSELCDLIALHPTLFADKLSWICSRCPPPHSPHVTLSHLTAISSLARLLSKSPPALPAVRSPLLHFISSIHPLAFRLSFWPHSFSLPNISLFFSDLFRHLSLAPALTSDPSLFGDIIVSAVACGAEERDIARVFLSAVAQNCPLVSAADAERVVSCLVERFVGVEDEEVLNSGSKGKGVEEDVGDDGSSEISSVQNGAFWVESVEGLEKLEIAFRLVRQVGDRAGRIKAEEVELFYKVAAKQLKSLPAFLKVVKL